MSENFDNLRVFILETLKLLKENDADLLEKIDVLTACVNQKFLDLNKTILNNEIELSKKLSELEKQYIINIKDEEKGNSVEHGEMKTKIAMIIGIASVLISGIVAFLIAYLTRQ